MAQSTVIEFLYGPRDGDVWPADVAEPLGPVLCPTTLRGPNGLPLLARYLPAEQNPELAKTAGNPFWMLVEPRKALIYDGWFVAKPGDTYGPRTGGMIGMEGSS